MGEAGSKKRKRDSESSKKTRKVVIDVPSMATVSSVLQPKFCPPVIAHRQGKMQTKQTNHAGGSELLLHSTAHRSLDYMAREDEPRGSKPLLNHFMGIYDPRTGRLEVIEARKMIVRGHVRAKQAPHSFTDDGETKQSMMERKADLGQTFGTKKAKKAIRDKELNAISPRKKAGDGLSTKMDDASRAMLESVGAMTSKMATPEELQAAVDEAKPVPKANVEALTVQDVYDPEVIIGADILNLVPIREWQEKARHKENIQVPSRFIAARINAIAMDDDATTRLRVLRYLGFVLIFYLCARRRGNTWLLPPREKLRELLAPAPEAVLENIRRKFSDAGRMSKFHMDLLMTHCCAFACIVDNFEVNTQDLQQDLKLDQQAMNRYFHEIGVRVKQTSNKAEGWTVHVARLALPLDFPKQRRIPARRR